MYIIQIGTFNRRKRRKSVSKNNRTVQRGKTSNHYYFIFLFLLSLLVAFSIFIGNSAIKLMAKGGNTDFLKMMIGGILPMMKSSDNRLSIPFPSFNEILFGFEPFDPKSILTSQVLALNLSKEEYDEATAEKAINSQASLSDENEVIGHILETTIQPTSPSGYAEAGGVYIKNSTSYQIDPEGLLQQPLQYDKSKKGPKVLITHTHTSEAYKPTETHFYKPSDPNRTQDPRFNVIRVGDEIEKVLKKANIEVIHDTAFHDYPNYNGSYRNSLAAVEAYLKKYPSIQIVLDIHRDAMARPDNTQLKVVTEIDGKKAAQVMIVCGSDEGGLSHPNWKCNLMFAMKLQQAMNEIYPTLARPIDFRKERFNMHTTRNSLILEVGSNANTLEEAILGGRAVGNALARLLNK